MTARSLCVKKAKSPIYILRPTVADICGIEIWVAKVDVVVRQDGCLPIRIRHWH